MSKSLERAQARRAGKTATRTVRSRIHDGYLADTHKPVSDDVFCERLRILSDIVEQGTKKRLYEIWAAKSVSDIATGSGHAHVAVDRVYGKTSWLSDDTFASDRVRRMVDESTGRLLRSCARQIKIITAILPAILPSHIWESLSQSDKDKMTLPWPTDANIGDIDYVERRNIIRSIRNIEKVKGRLPSDPYDVILCPTLSTDNFVCPLDASDDQQVRLSGNMLSILLPICEYPGKNDWVWHSIKLNIPDYAAKRYANGEICRPSIRVDGDDTYLLVPLDIPTPEKRVTGRTLSCDWGVRKLATCSVIYIRDGEAITTGRPFHFIGSGFQDKQHDRKDQAQILGKKAWAIERLLSNKPDLDSALSSKLDFYKRERACVWGALHRADDQYARAAAL